MKPLNKLNNVEKARLFHQLLPDTIPALLVTIESICDKVISQREELAKGWDVPIISPYMWVSLAEDTKRILKQYNKPLIKSPVIFSDQLFDGYNAIFVNHCIQQHAKLEETPEIFKSMHRFLYSLEV